MFWNGLNRRSGGRRGGPTFLILDMAGLLGSHHSTAAQALSGAAAPGLQTTGKQHRQRQHAPATRASASTLETAGTVGTGVSVQSFGVQAIGVQSLRDRYLDAQVASEGSVTSMLQSKYDSLSRAQAGLGETVDTRIGSAGSRSAIRDLRHQRDQRRDVDDLFQQRFRRCLGQPHQRRRKNRCSCRAPPGSLADRAQFRRRQPRRRTGRARPTASAATWTDANGLLKNIADAQLSRSAPPRPVQPRQRHADLRDQRQSAIEALSQKMDVHGLDLAGLSQSGRQISARDSQRQRASRSSINRPRRQSHCPSTGRTRSVPRPTARRPRSLSVSPAVPSRANSRRATW